MKKVYEDGEGLEHRRLDTESLQVDSTVVTAYNSMLLFFKRKKELRDM